MSEDLLEILRDLQERSQDQRRVSFSDWRDDPDLRKAPRAGGTQTSLVGGYNPGLGMMGSLGTSSYAPTGPRSRPSGNQAVGLKQFPQQFGVPSGYNSKQGQSKYLFERPDQPAPWIDDVDMGSIWYSPMEPVWPFGPPYYNRPREWNYPVGYNLNYVPQRMSLFGMLRGMRQSYGVLATVIETRKDQLLRLPWTIQQRDKPRATSKAVEEVRRFFRRPDRKLTYGQWSRKLLDDLFVIDAPCMYINRDRGGKPTSIEVLDGATIFPLIDDAGRRPDSIIEHDPEGVSYLRRQPAFQQIIYGLPMVNLDETELIYAMMRPRPEMPMFGFSPVEQILVEATEAVRKTWYQLEFWRAGSMPELVVTVPDNWTPRQIAMFQGHFDALLSGNLNLKSKVRFLPGGMKPFDIKNASGESLWSQRDELLVRLTCYAFSVSPTPFVRQMNRATAQNAQQSAQEEGLYPLMSWWKDDVMDRIIQEEFGYDGIEFVFLPRPEVDLEKQSKIHQVQLREGIRSINEVREELGQEPIEDGNEHLIYTGAGALRLEDVIKGIAALPGAAAPVGGGSKPGGSPPALGSNPMRGSPAPPQRGTMPRPKPTPVEKLAEILAEGLEKISHKDVKRAAKEAKRKPSKDQKDEGNYRKGHIWIQGLDVSIENAKGSKRGEKTESGKKKFVRMPAPYGYIRGFIGADDEHMDVYIGKHPESNTVWVIDQDKVDEDTGANSGFDEHKCMIGYKTLKRAIKDYQASHYDGRGHERVHTVVELSMDEFKSWLRNGNLHEPIASQEIGEVVLTAADMKKVGDTISQSTGLLSYSYLPAKKRKKRKKLESGPRWLELSV